MSVRTESRYLTPAQAADVIDVGAKQVRRLASQGKIAGYKRGQEWLLDAASVRTYRERYPKRKRRPNALDDKAKVKALYRRYGSQSQIADALGCSLWSVSKAIKRHNIDAAAIHDEPDQMSSAERSEILKDKGKLEALYQKHRNQKRVARELGCSLTTVKRAMRRHGIQAQSRAECARGRKRLAPATISRWQDMVEIFKARGVRPPTLEEMCPVNCPGRDWCLESNECYMATEAQNN